MWSESLYIYFCVHQLPDDLSLLPVEMQEVEERRSEVEVGRGLFESLTIRENAKVYIYIRTQDTHTHHTHTHTHTHTHSYTIKERHYYFR